VLGLALERVREQGGVDVLYAGSLVNHKLYLGVPAHWSLGGSPANFRPSDLVWSSDDGFVRGTWRPPSFTEKLLSGVGIEVTGNLARALVASQEESRKRLGYWEAILLVSASTKWTRGGFVPIDTTG
jgi:hypothetical protein